MLTNVQLEDVRLWCKQNPARQSQPATLALLDAYKALTIEVAALRELVKDNRACVANGPECEEGCYYCGEPWHYDFQRGVPNGRGHYVESHAADCPWVALANPLLGQSGDSR